MFSVRIEKDFAAAHFLSHYKGKCERLHGHNYRVRAWVSSRTLDDGGMVLDFSLLKKALAAVLDGELDHRLLNDIAYFEGDPSAERIARFVFERLAAALPGSPLSAVEVFESPTSMARYEPD